MLCVLLCALNVSATEHMTWEDKQYHYLYGDFNGDKVPDLFLQSLSEQTSSLIILGQTIDGNTQYLVENEVTLPDIVDGHLWNNTEANIAIFDHNHDGLSDIFIVIHSQKTALVVNGDENDIDFSNIAHSYSKKEFKWLKKSEKYVLYAEDFNGDNQHDLLAVSEKNNTHYLMHASDANSLSVVQEIKKSFKWAKKSDVDVKIADFNNDGKADIFAVARAKKTKHYYTYADENGLLGETTVIKEKINNKDWNADDFSFVVTHADADEALDLVRLNNMPGGIDENGELIEAEVGEDVDDIANDCDQLFYSVENQSEGESCAPWSDVTVDTTPGLVGTSKPSVATQSLTTDVVTQMAIPIECSPLDPCGETTPPETPSSYPSVDGGSYHIIGSQIRVRYNSVHMANYYEIYMSTTNSGYSKVATTPSLSTLINVRSNWGYNYIKYRACNTTGGCSGLSPWRRIYAYTAPGAPGSLSFSPSSVYKGQSYTATFGFANGSVDGATYTLYEKYGSGSYSPVCSVRRNHWSESEYSCTISGKSVSGTYYYYAQVCNPGITTCGGWKTGSVKVVNRSPNAVDDSANVKEGASVTVSVLNNDSDPDGDNLKVLVDDTTSPSSGSVSCNTTTCTYTASNSISADLETSFKYTISDGDGGTATATVSIDVENKIEGTVATPSITSGKYQESKSIRISTTTSGASIYYNTDGSNNYKTYNDAFDIEDTTTVKAYATKHDWYDSGKRTETITINHAPTANNDTDISVKEGESVDISVLNNDSDPDGDSLSISSKTNPSSGSVSCSTTKCTYTASNSISADVDTSFKYTISDGEEGTATATVSIDVENKIEGTVARPSITSGKYQESKSISISTTTSGASIHYRTGNSGLFETYDDSIRIYHTTTFQAYATKHDWNDSGTRTETIIINHAPTANNDTDLIVNEGESLDISVLNNDSDPDGDNLSVDSIITQPLTGSVECDNTTCTYTASDSLADDISTSFEYKITDNQGGFDTASVDIFVNVGPNNTPTISGTPIASIGVDGSYLFTPEAEDLDGNLLTFSIDGKPAWAEFDEATGALSGTPQTSDVGIDSNIIISVTDNIITEPVSLEAFDIEVQNSIVSYTYDARGRLKKVENNTGKQVNYTLDDAGNRITTGNEDQ
jgi:YD repeat-containing protein